MHFKRFKLLSTIFATAVTVAYSWYYCMLINIVLYLRLWYRSQIYSIKAVSIGAVKLGYSYYWTAPIVYYLSLYLYTCRYSYAAVVAQCIGQCCFKDQWCMYTQLYVLFIGQYNKLIIRYPLQQSISLYWLLLSYVPSSASFI